MNILHIISGDLWAGAEVQAFSLIRACRGSDLMKLQVVTFNNGILSENLRKEGIPVTVFDEHMYSMFSLIAGCARLIRSSQSGIVHVHGFKENFVGGIAARLVRHATIIRTHHGKGMVGVGLKYNLIERINAGFLTDEVIAVSQDLKSLLVNFGIPPERITVVHNGIEPLAPLDSSKARALRSELGIAGNEKVIGTVGRLVPIKDHRMLLEGARIILEREPLTRFVIVGDGPDMDSLKNLACDLGITSRVCFPGFRDDAADFLGLFDIFCMTSLHEGIPMALLEAMSLGLPIVATQVGGMKEVIHDNESGLLVSSRNARSFADACLRVLRNETTRERISRNAMLRVREGFLLDRTVKLTQDIYGRSIQQ